MNIKDISKKGVVTAMIAVSMVAGAAGGSLLSGVHANAQSTTTAVAPATTAVSPAATAPSTGSSVTTDPNQQGGTFHSNEDSTHEASESPAREAQENAGQRPTAQ